MIKVVTAQQMRDIDGATINEIGIPGLVLMENAGERVVEAIKEAFPDYKSKRICVFAGKGNNGGDGFVIARKLMNLGAAASVFLTAAKDEVKGGAGVNLAAFENMGGAIKEITEQRHLNNFKLKFMHADIMVDALLGTGLSSAPRGIYKDVIALMNQSGAYKVAVDVPSGMNSDSGVLPGDCVKADLTVTLGLPKVGLLTYPARKYAGRIVTADISIPSKVVDQSPCAACLLEEKDIVKALPPREEDANKGRFGHLLMACGSVGMGGTAAMAGLGALRMGAGLVTAAAPDKVCAAYEAAVPEMMTLPLPSSDSGVIIESAADLFLEKASGMAAVLIGPGLRQEPSTREFVKRLIGQINIPMVIDADGLNLIGGDSFILERAAGPVVITPHPGEMARLTGASVKDIQEDRLAAASAYADKTGAVMVLKGANTVIASAGKTPRINPTGNAGLATGGSGDVLAGMIGGLLAQGADPLDAATAAVWLHGACADFYSESRDPRTMIPADMPFLIPEVVTRLVRS